MIIGDGNDRDDPTKKVIFFGLCRENITRLTAGEPMRISQESHPGFPLVDTEILIVFAETMTDIVRLLQRGGAVDSATKVVAVPPKHNEGEPS